MAVRLLPQQLYYVLNPPTATPQGSQTVPPGRSFITILNPPPTQSGGTPGNFQRAITPPVTLSGSQTVPPGTSFITPLTPPPTQSGSQAVPQGTNFITLLNPPPTQSGGVFTTPVARPLVPTPYPDGTFTPQNSLIPRGYYPWPANDNVPRGFPVLYLPGYEPVNAWAYGLGTLQQVGTTGEGRPIYGLPATVNQASPEGRRNALLAII